MFAGISGQPLPASFPYASIINQLCGDRTPPCLVGAIKFNETGLGCGPETENCVSFDGGRGVMQLTSSYPSDWTDPRSNIGYAIAHFIDPAIDAWIALGLQGDDLVRAVAASYNEGLGTAELAHKTRDDVDAYTTHAYGMRALEEFKRLVS